MQQGIIEKNHMDILWHDYALNKEDTIPITKAGLIEKASVVGRWNHLYRRHWPDVH